MKFASRITTLFALAALALAGSAGAASGTLPANTAPPTVSGSVRQGDTLTAQSGSWNGTTPIAFTYRWRRCDSAGGSCSNLSGATGQTYTLVAADIGHSLRIDVTATNSAGSSSASSGPTAVVTAAAAPANTVPPTISGIARQGQTLTAQNGSWTGTQPIAFAYRWRRCDSAGGACRGISGPRLQTYTLGARDVGHTVRVDVTATNTGGAASALSAPSGVVAPTGNAPAVTSAPQISGMPQEGQTLRLNRGSWSGSTPIAHVDGWQRCDGQGGGCATIAGQTRTSYMVVSADVGHTLRGVVTASNSIGSTLAYSAPTAVVSSRAPVSTTLPQISGTATIGATLQASAGTWSGVPPISFAFQWVRNNARGGWDPIPGAAAQAYTLVAADLGHKLFVQVKATNANGSGFADSPQIGPVAGAAGAVAVPVASVSLPDRLVVSRVQASPAIVRSRQPVVIRFRVTDLQGHPVQGALVYALGLPYGWVANAPETPTAGDGWATIVLRPTVRLPLHRGGALVLFVRTRKPGENLLAGVSTRRLVQIRLGPPG
jgi:hypothetical protein